MKSRRFVVDAALLHELGERLIGRPAIALGELVKNSFDADAATCRIEFGKDEIVISDDGTGMAEDDFLRYWMRVGTTHKVDQAVSKKHSRPLTGSKGIGRLSAQFLADEIELETTSANEQRRSVYAKVDWRKAVRGQDLRTVNVRWEVRSNVVAYPGGSKSGTRITLKNLKSEWGVDDIRLLGDEVWMLRSPFRRFRRDTGTGSAQDFDIEIEASEITGGREAFDEKFRVVFSNWKARIRGTLEDGRAKGRASISVEFRKGYPEGSEEAVRFREIVRLPIQQDDSRKSGDRDESLDETDLPVKAKSPSRLKSLVDNAAFEVLVFKAEGRQPGGISVSDLRRYLEKFGNVSVYDAGFRLPYYGSGRGDAAGQDWLLIAADQGRRLNASELLPQHLRTQNKYMQDLPAPGRIFGAVDIDTNHERAVAQKAKARPGEWLQIQPGRDRLHDNQAFDQLRDLVRLSLDFYANRYRVLALKMAEKRRAKEPVSRKYDRAIEVLESHKPEMRAPVFVEIRRELRDARKAAVAEEETGDQRTALLAPLASAGMAALALNHEISRETGFLRGISTRLRRIAAKHNVRELQEIADEFDEANRRLDSLRELFAPLLSDIDKSATDRLRVRAVVDQVVGAMHALMPGVNFDRAGIPMDLRFPIGSLAEWNALLQNVLSNAWNALLDSNKAQVSFSGGRDRRGREWLHVSDSGQGLDVPLSDADKLFEPFERRITISDDKRSIAIGGQGLGLAIVRMIAHRRSATVGFVPPEGGFSTTFEIAWRGAKQ